MTKVVVLLSGGLDSAVCAALAVEAHGRENVTGIFFNISQPNFFQEAEAVSKLTRHFKLHELKTLELRMPARRNDQDALIPGRNAVFLSLACAWAELWGCDVVFYGPNSDDWGNYPDCRESFVNGFNHMLVESSMSVRVKTPLLHMTKADVFREARRLEVPVEKTWSCYRSKKAPCGECDSCRLRQKALSEIGDELNTLPSEPKSI